jgi:pimeloyl-ACP methyl ester carboxylesterase
MGGAVAQELALQRPGLVERLILADTFAHMDLRAARAMSLCMKTLRDCGLKTGLQLIYWLIFGPGFYEKNLDDLDAQIDLFLGDPVSTEVFEYQAAACLAHDTRDRLEELDCPVLVIHGAEDDLLRPEAAVEMTESIPYSLLSIFEDGGHLCIWEQSERFRREVLDFLA